ncbi:hypothetical protein ACEPAH_5839 [Sanghuangporus vaninii]
MVDMDSPTTLPTNPMQLTAPNEGLPVGSYYQEPPNDLSGGLPINLDSLRDGPPGSKPFYPYSTLIRYAIKGSPTQKLLLEDIYYAIESRFPYFRTAPPGWKNSVRHNLSLNPCFEKVPRPLTDRGKGSYWTVNDNIDPRTGVHRIRKRRGKQSKRNSHNEVEQDIDYAPDEVAAPAPTAGFESAAPAYEQPQPVAAPPATGTSESSEIAQYMTVPEFDANGNVNWRSAWHNELTKLQHITAEQDKLQVDQEWYREMLFRVRTAMMAPMDPNGVLQLGPPPPGIPAGVEPTQEPTEQSSQ